ncbi:hypothetical protein KP509_38G016900 [Ceratopteris richardii]|uniref:Very-long-chain (3R)-3-hydroxyacyl-CoA dehydratase n=1 Tax=Ceratopteris richardii TaxID=49495 RepID=A0A8T2Q2N9_CERRI|nr:hypothetical protein KP509_38G016900 [Ceratopteris richardii]
MAGLAILKHVYLVVYNWVVLFGWLQVLLEIFHDLFGLIRSAVSATLPQIRFGIYVTWNILWNFPETRTTGSITELIRYSFFCMEAFGITPSFLQWLKYSTFYVLYPTGISSEVGLILTAPPYVKFNMAFDNHFATLFTLASYILGSPYMYTYVIGQ